MTRIHTIDLDYLGQPESIAAYLVLGDGAPILVEAGPGVCTEALTRGLAAYGVTPRDLGHVLLTHIHFDHAGAAGWLAAQGATVYVHSFGAKHLIDPSKLVASATRIYGDRMDTLWGPLLPIPERQVVGLDDHAELELEGVHIRVLETPGHARHHHAFAMETDEGRVAFTGDAAATFVHEAPDFVSLPTPPPEFDLEAWLQTIDRIGAENFDRVYPTHFGVVEDPPAYLDRVRGALHAHAGFIRDRFERAEPTETIRNAYAEWFASLAREAGVPASKMGFYVKDSLAHMNTTGMLRYWTKRAERSTC